MTAENRPTQLLPPLAACPLAFLAALALILPALAPRAAAADDDALRGTGSQLDDVPDSSFIIPTVPLVLGHWVFDGRSPVPDLSGNASPWILQNVAHVYDAAYDGVVAEFDGATSLVSFNPTPQPCAVSTQITIGAIVRPDFSQIPNNRNTMRVVARRTGSTWGYMLDFQRQDSVVYARLVLRNGTNHHANSRPLTESDVWYEVVGYWESTDPATSATVVVDGDATGGSSQGSPAFTEIDASDATLLIGAASETFGPTRFFRGRIAEVKIIAGIVPPENVFPQDARIRVQVVPHRPR